MAFERSNFGPVGGFHGSNRANNETGIALFSYISADTLATVKAAGYFNELRDEVNMGDLIYVGSTQLDDDSSDNEYTIVLMNSVTTSPSAANVTTSTKDINAT